MKPSLRILAAATIAACILPVTAFAQTESGGAPGSWLSGYAGARTVGLGGAFVATADDALGVLWNPAGLQWMDQNMAMFESVRLFEDTSINSLSFALPGSRLPSLGVSIVSLTSGEFQRTNELNNPLGTFSEGETAYLFSLAKGFGSRLTVGTNFKLVHQSVEEFSGGGFGMDLGGIYQVTPGLRVGASVLNLGGPSITLRSAAETYPTEIRGGLSLEMLNGRAHVNAEVDHANGPGTSLHGGAEYWVQPGIALRFGYSDDRATGGFTYRFGPQYQMDYGVADHALGLTHRVGFSYRFGGFYASNRAEPEVFSPTGDKAVTKISLNAKTKAKAENWSLEIVSKSGQVVRRFGGPGLPPAHVLWDGKDETGMPVADGVYTYHLTVKDADGRELNASSRKVEISTGGPQVTVPVQTNP
jgi:flagellar hook capping protein FlgD